MKAVHRHEPRKIVFEGETPLEAMRLFSLGRRICCSHDLYALLGASLAPSRADEQDEPSAVRSRVKRRNRQEARRRRHYYTIQCACIQVANWS